jgi:hypothetical protein
VATTTALDIVGFVAVANGTEISNIAPTLICSQNIVLTNSYFFNNKVFGLLGNIGLVISASRTLGWSAKIGKNGATPADIVGYGYFSDVASITVPVNLISNIASGFQTFSIGDTVRVEIYAQNVSAGSNPTIIATVPLIQGVYNALTNQNVVLPASGTLTRTSVTDGPELLDPANTYTVANQVGESVDVFTYPATTFQRTFNSTLEPGQSTAPFTGAVYFDVDTADVPPPPPFPTSPITITEATSEVPIAIDPDITYTFINNSGGALVLTAFTNGTPTVLADPFADNATVIAPSSGFTGFTATSGSPPPFPPSPVTVTTANEVPIGIDPDIQYTFTNGGASTMTITLFADGQPPGPTLAPTLVGQSVVAPSAGFTGFTAAFA